LKCSQCKSVWLRDRNAGINIRDVTKAVASGLPMPSFIPVNRFPQPTPPQTKKRKATSRAVIMAKGRANKKAKKEQEAAVVPVMAITKLTTNISTQSSKPGIFTQKVHISLY
jgi:hypothetical protein